MVNEDTEMTDGNGRKMSVTGTDDFMKSLDQIIPKTHDDRSRIVEAGVPVAESQLTESSPELTHKYPSQNKLGSKPRKPLHIKEAVTHKPGQYLDGSTDVGFSKQAAPIARWVDQGTYRQDPQFFIEHAFENLDTEKLFGLQKSETIKLLKEKNPNLNIQDYS